MLLTEDLDHLYEFFLLRGIHWKVRGEYRIPTRAEIELLVSDCVDTVRGESGSISIEIGSLLVKRTDAKIDIYVHVGAMEYDD
jgi:hypothetical protein